MGVSGKKVVFILYGLAVVLCLGLLLHGLAQKRHKIPDPPADRPSMPG